MNIHKPLHPGKTVRQILIDGTGLSITQADEHLGVTRATLTRLLNGKSRISPEMATRLSKLVGTIIDMWISLQAQYDMYLARQCANDIIVHPLDDVA